MVEDSMFIRLFYKELMDRKIKYCILRNADEVKNGDAHDIDMTVESDYLKVVEDVLFSVADALDWKLHMIMGSSKDRYNIKCYHFFKIVKIVNDVETIRILHFDIFPTFTWNGYILLDNATLIANINDLGLYQKVDPAIEAITKLFIRLLHNGYIKTKYKDHIKLEFNRNEIAVTSILRKFLDLSTTQYVIGAVKEEKWKDLEDNRGKLINVIKKYSRHNLLGQKIYLLKKAFNKAGIMIAFEGADGSGKSTIIDNLPNVLGNTFSHDMLDYYHWRPGFIKKEKKSLNGTSTIVTEPHAKKPYGRIKSFAKLMFFNFDYIFGYWFKIRWQIAKGHLVVFDRYYYDYYLDKLRYRLNISDVTLDIFKIFIPSPEITFLLVGDADKLYERKKEISVYEIEKQIDIMLTNKNKFTNPKVINVNQSLDKVVCDVSKEILEKCAKKIGR